MEAKDAAAERAETCVAVEGAVEEDVPGGTLLLAAYGALWLVLMLYMVRLLRLHRGLSTLVQDLRRELGES